MALSRVRRILDRLRPAPSGVAFPSTTPPPEAAPSRLAPRAPGPMRVAAISRFLDEADILEAFLRHTASYVDHHVLLDNGSRDGSLEIVRALKEEGLPLTVFQNISVNMNEERLNTLLYHHAATELQADWVLGLDVDEFIDDRAVEGGLSAGLARTLDASPDLLCLTVPYLDYVFEGGDDSSERIVPLRFRRRRRRASRMRKIILRAHLPGAVLENGNHGALLGGEPVAGQDLPGLRLAHYPHRSPYQMATKSAKGWAKVLACGPATIATDTCRHYRPLFARLRDEPEAHFRNPEVMRPPHDPTLVDDPILYRGGPLRYTAPTDEPMRALRGMMGYLDDLAAHYGRLIETCPEARALNDAWNRDTKRIL